MQVGEVRAAEDSDFEHLRTLCTCHDGWRMAYSKNNGTVTVWIKSNEMSEFNMIKVLGVLKDVSAAVVYDVLNDPAYRKKWDFAMFTGFDICSISPNSDIGYYAMKIPKPLKNRDFVTQRVWLDLGNELMIFNHSVNHVAVPPKKNFVRGISYLTGYRVLATGANKDEPGCQITYVTQSDPRGKLPVWAVNKVSQFMAPKIMSKLLKGCRHYKSWKAKHSPEMKPWLFPEQNSLPRFSPADIAQWDLTTVSPVIDERSAVEQEASTGSEAGDEEDDLQMSSTEPPTSSIQLTSTEPSSTDTSELGAAAESVAEGGEVTVTAEVTTEVMAVAAAAETPAVDNALTASAQ